MWSNKMCRWRKQWQKKTSTPQVEFPYDEAAEKECDHKIIAVEVADFALLNPGAGWGAKQWPAERYGSVAASWRKMD